MLSKEKISKYLDTPIRVEIFDLIDSTNTYAKKLASSVLDEDVCIIARSQASGRGRMGRSFFSPDGGLYMSLLLRRDLKAADATHLTTAAAVAVSRAIDSVAGISSSIKWVNDIYLNGKKVCGILTEGKTLPNGMLDFAVVGIGVNLTAPAGGFPSDIAERAGAVFETLPNGADSMLAARIINEFLSLIRTESKELCLNEYRARSFIVGKDIDVISLPSGVSKPAKAIGIDDDYRLIVRYDNGQSEALSSGEVSVRI